MIGKIPDRLVSVESEADLKDGSRNDTMKEVNKRTCYMRRAMLLRVPIFKTFLIRMDKSQCSGYKSSTQNFMCI